MPDKPLAHTEDLANTEYDAGRRARAEVDPGAVPAERETSKPLPVPGEGPEVGLNQKGTGEDAIVRRETEI
ncbi:hypothetical protein [uncultured Methylobacterium sp.]|uniref:hypothetical protein n=1 Tax=uncultured Methylobacterium sp. TaxID=157278 RepID=UPI0035C97080